MKRRKQKPVRKWMVPARPMWLLVFFWLTRRRLSDGSGPYVFLWLFEWFFWPTRHRLSDGYDIIRRLTDLCGHIYKKKYIFVIFGRFKRKNPCAVGSNRRILDWNVVVTMVFHDYYKLLMKVIQETPRLSTETVDIYDSRLNFMVDSHLIYLRTKRTKRDD